MNIRPNVRYVTDYRIAPRQHVIMKLQANEENRALGGGTRECRVYAGISR